MADIDRILVHWAEEEYQPWINRQNVRDVLIGRDGGCPIYQLGSQPVARGIQRGTLLDDNGDGTGHYMSFAKNRHQVFVYDPSGVTGPYAPEDPEFFNAQLRVNFPDNEIVHWEAERNPAQSNDWDSFCQTWSLAWLHPDLQSKVIQAERLRVDHEGNNSRKQRILRDIIDHFCSDPICPAPIADAWHSWVYGYFNRYFSDELVTVVRTLFL